MINSRSLSDLNPKVAALASEFINRCKAKGIDVLITSTYRDAASQNALYAVAIFISTVIVVPSRALTQIVAPITAKLMAENKHNELNDLYKKSAINLQVIGGFIMMLIFLGKLARWSLTFLISLGNY
jgi:O-antigen/teichoic acid export membrane protein